MVSHNADLGAMVVTGATGSIGEAIVEQLFAQGVSHIFGACRHPERLKATEMRLRSTYPHSKSVIVPVELDLSTIKGARLGAERIVKHGLPLSAVINNAGTMPVKRLEISSDGYDMSLQVNCLSTLAFTFDLVPDIMHGGVVVMTSSVTRHLPLPRQNFVQKGLNASNVIQRFNNYGRSKQLLTWASRMLADDLAPRGIRVNCADPGVVDSGIIHLGYKWADEIADVIARPFMRSPHKGCRAALNALHTPLTAQMVTVNGQHPIHPLTYAESLIAGEVLRTAAQMA